MAKLYGVELKEVNDDVFDVYAKEKLVGQARCADYGSESYDCSFDISVLEDAINKDRSSGYVYGDEYVNANGISNEDVDTFISNICALNDYENKYKHAISQNLSAVFVELATGDFCLLSKDEVETARSIANLLSSDKSEPIRQLMRGEENMDSKYVVFEKPEDFIIS